MIEGPRIVVVYPRVTEHDVIAGYEAMGIALQRLAAITRLHGNETARYCGSESSAKEVLIAWRNAFDFLEDCVLSAAHAHTTIMGNAPAVSRAFRAAEAND